MVKFINIVSNHTNTSIEIKGIETPKQSKAVGAVYSKKMDRIYLFDICRGKALNSIQLSYILSNCKTE